MPPDLLAQLIAENPDYQARAKETAVKNIKSIDRMGILCLTATARCDQMWNEYADYGCGFVVAFDTTHAAFGKMTGPLGIRNVSYSDEGFATFLGMMEKSVFEPLYRKRMEYSFEQEWRSIRLLKDLERHPNDVFLAPFDPGLIREIVIGPNCGVEPQLLDIVARDQRYQHVQIVTAQGNF